jgi:hypothetical protein
LLTTRRGSSLQTCWRTLSSWQATPPCPSAPAASFRRGPVPSAAGCRIAVQWSPCTVIHRTRHFTPHTVTSRSTVSTHGAAQQHAHGKELVVFGAIHLVERCACVQKVLADLGGPAWPHSHT